MIRAPVASAAAPDPTYVAELIAQADALDLADDPEWLALVHYEPRRFLSGVVSSADSAWFFQAGDGKTNPSAELRATLRRLASDDRMKDGEPPQCALRGRYVWLDRRLHFDAARLPPQRCAEFDDWRRALDARSMTLIFPEAYLNNPSSMFGHTLLRIDGGSTESDLLAYGVNFSADTGGDGGVAFAWKGIVGDYPGRFGMEPYYDVVRRYGDWENRDIWEYRLALDPEALELLVAHLWELRGVEFDYYFFDENCSYQILALLDVARPDLRLREQVPAWVIPADTIRAVVAEPGLVSATRFRPSTASVLRHDAAQLSAAERDLASRVADGRVAPKSEPIEPLSSARRAAVLGTAYELCRYRYLTTDDATPEVQHRARSILLARSRVPVEGSPLPPPPTPAVRPDEGHPAACVGAGVGVRDGRVYLEAHGRPAYHDLLDPQGGYTAGAAIDFLDLTLRYYTGDRDLRVHRFTLVDIVSLAPIDAFLHPISWTVGTELFSRLVPRGRADALEETYVWRSHGGAGLAGEPWRHALAYVLADATVDYSSSLEEDHAIGPGARIGLFIGPASDGWRIDLHADVTRFALGDVSTASSVGADVRVTLSQRLAITGAISGHRDFDQNWLEAAAALNLYF